jgi:hypothetical protein
MRAYQGALNLQSLEVEHFQGQKIAPSATVGLSTFEYFKIKLDRELRQIRLNLLQFQAGNFWLQNLSIASQQQENEVLQRLDFIESVIAKYRQEAEEPIPTTEPVESSGGLVQRAPKAGFWTSPPDPNAQNEEALIQQFRLLRQQRKIGIRFLVLLVVIPLCVQVISKNFIYSPIVDYFRVSSVPIAKIQFNEEIAHQYLEEFTRFREALEIQELLGIPSNDGKTKEQRLQHKAEEIVDEAAHRSQEGIKNILADLTSLVTFTLLIIFFKKQFAIARSFIGHYFLGLSDVTKVFIFILLTDIFVGFHSAEGWEVVLGSLMSHVGLTENRNLIFVFIATVPVLLDSLFKLLIFNYFTRRSPSAVAILEKMQK